MADEPKREERQLEDKEQRKSEEERVYRALETARQAVKPIVKREMEGEVFGDDLLSMRLKGG
jgi:hypothetical protein